MSHKKAVAIARRQARSNKRLFDKMGSQRGWVMSAYRQAHRALRDVIQRGALHEIPEVLGHLETALRAGVSQTLREAWQAGVASAANQLQAYDIRPIPGGGPNLTLYENQWLQVLDAQRAKVATVVFGEDDPVRIIGDQDRQGIVRPAPFVTEGYLAVITIGAIGYKRLVERTSEVTKTVFLRQAVAAIDDRTTDCCLSVHAQAVAMDKPFRLTGTPRFADKMMSPPFHWGPCRTVEALVRPKDADDELTQRLRAATEQERQARAEQEKIKGPVSGVER